jgi:hypothetical protein
MINYNGGVWAPPLFYLTGGYNG